MCCSLERLLTSFDAVQMIWGVSASFYEVIIACPPLVTGLAASLRAVKGK